MHSEGRRTRNSINPLENVNNIEITLWSKVKKYGDEQLREERAERDDDDSSLKWKFVEYDPKRNVCNEDWQES